MFPTCDYHTHPQGHTVRPYTLELLQPWIDQCRAKNIQSIAFTDHDRYVDGVDFGVIDRLREQNPEIEILAGIELVSYTTGPMLGNAEAGAVASLFSIRTSIVSGGVLCVVGSALLALSLPAFLRYDGRTGLARKRAADDARAADNADNNAPELRPTG